MKLVMTHKHLYITHPAEHMLNANVAARNKFEATCHIDPQGGLHT